MTTHDASPAMQKARQATWEYEADATSGILYEGTPESTARLVIHAVRLCNALAQLVIYVDEVQRSWSPPAITDLPPVTHDWADRGPQPGQPAQPAHWADSGGLAAVMVGPPRGQHARPASRLEADPPSGHYQPRHAGHARTLEARGRTGEDVSAQLARLAGIDL